MSSVGWCCLVLSFLLGGVVVFFLLLLGGAAWSPHPFGGVAVFPSPIGWCRLVSSFLTTPRKEETKQHHAKEDKGNAPLPNGGDGRQHSQTGETAATRPHKEGRNQAAPRKKIGETQHHPKKEETKQHHPKGENERYKEKGKRKEQIKIKRKRRKRKTIRKRKKKRKKKETIEKNNSKRDKNKEKRQKKKKKKSATSSGNLLNRRGFGTQEHLSLKNTSKFKNSSLLIQAPICKLQFQPHLVQRSRLPPSPLHRLQTLQHGPARHNVESTDAVNRHHCGCGVQIGERLDGVGYAFCARPR